MDLVLIYSLWKLLLICTPWNHFENLFFCDYCRLVSSRFNKQRSLTCLVVFWSEVDGSVSFPPKSLFQKRRFHTVDAWLKYEEEVLQSLGEEHLVANRDRYILKIPSIDFLHPNANTMSLNLCGFVGKVLALDGLNKGCLETT